MSESRYIFSTKHLAIGIFLGVVAWIASGVLLKAESNAPVKKLPLSEAVTSVRIETKQAVPKTKIVQVYGVTEASRRVDLKAEVEGRVTKIVAREGSFVTKDAEILHIEMRDREAALAEAEAVVKQRKIDYKVAQKLAMQGYKAETNLAEALAKLEAAKAQAIRAKVSLDNTVIRAPFDGFLEKINAEEGALVGPGILTGQGSLEDGSTIVTIIDRDPLVVSGQISERVIGELSRGTVGKATLVTGETVEGKVVFIGALADSVTRTFRVELEIPNPDGKVASGITAAIAIPVRTEMVHHVSSSTLALDSDGNLGVKVLEITDREGNQVAGIVKFHPITIFDNDINGLWVVGLPEEMYLITVGQAFVNDGVTVTSTLAQGG